MSALKDVVDLIEKLNKSIKDRKTLELLLPIKEKLIQAGNENLTTERKVFETERQHVKEMDDLKSLHVKEMEKLKSHHTMEMEKLTMHNKNLQSEIDQLKSKPKTSIQRRLVRG